MQLNTWDFGGQQIYHATHQFFLTNRSLFVLVWNARHGFEQGKLYYWLETIQALAPESPILVVATWLDERDADLPKSELSDKFPQIVDYFEVSNKTGEGIEKLKNAITDTASGLPLMGLPWPADWLNAAESIRDLEKKAITPQRLLEIMDDYGISNEDVRILTRWMHDLGDLLYFSNNDELNDTVILKPQWVTEYISKVLESEDVITQKGIFTRDHMHILWKDLDANMHDHFLRLMEQFDLSYRTLANREISLVVERLPLDPPNYEQRWDEIKENNDCHEISMKFVLSTIPAGVPTWFIARTHRFSTHIHWRNGALFTDNKEEHLALVEAFTNERYLHLTVRGPNPHNFFAILKDGIEVTLDRFPGLQIDRFIPCPGHVGKICKHQFDYEHLLNRIEERPMIECPESKPLEDVSVPNLLFGIHFHTQDDELDRIDELEVTIVDKQDNILAELIELRELTQREFTNIYRREQSIIDSHCPNVFVLRPRESKSWKDIIVGQKIDLQLYCQAPGCWHPTAEGGLYTINNPAEWIKTTAPYLQKMVKVLKYAASLIGPWVAVAEPVYSDMFNNDIKLMTELIKKLPDLKGDHDVSLTHSHEESLEPGRVGGAALRAVRSFLVEEDKPRHWGGLKKILTPEGHYLWLCEHHAEKYDI